MDSPASFLSDPPTSDDATALYEVGRASDGYVANYLRTWCWRPDVYAAFVELRADLLADSSLSDREVAVMVAAAASALGDSYCSLAWGEKLADASDEATAAGVLRGLDADLSDRESALAAWAREVVRDPNGTREEGIERLREAGLSEREIFEATAWIALRLAFSTINDALGARPDRELVARVPPAVRDAVTFGRTAAGSD
jgi:uncharacterized peroxidase-related enzyme